ncbi:hypothetical protein MIND_00143900 [Mycena indigotica]|uniref:Uncharacterized protein n=1 Tax=Mycena indigotica TaxID=2126181 RepID=A0A8H6TEJ3_9AGAR|nr:uncharacterized protein MIND_00143900 [Mycena indigotica]KAF7316253.1 hypothetical protein MIND_00143900 [Mycena indigotica]
MPGATTKATLISPSEPNRVVYISSPTLRSLNEAMSSGMNGPPDHSWDSSDYVAQFHGPDKSEIFSRPSKSERHGKVKEVNKTLAERLATLEKASREAEAERKKDRESINLLRREHTKDMEENVKHLNAEVKRLEIVEEYEAVVCVLRACNDEMFENTRTEHRDILKAAGLNWITKLLSYSPAGGADSDVIEDAVQATLGLLTSEERALCLRLNEHLRNHRLERHRTQHPKISPLTAFSWLDKIVPTFRETYLHLLARKPKILHSLPSDSPSDRHIFPEDTLSQLDATRERLQVATKRLEEWKEV